MCKTPHFSMFHVWSSSLEFGITAGWSEYSPSFGMQSSLAKIYTDLLLCVHFHFYFLLHYDNLHQRYRRTDTEQSEWRHACIAYRPKLDMQCYNIAACCAKKDETNITLHVLYSSMDSTILIRNSSTYSYQLMPTNPRDAVTPNQTHNAVAYTKLDVECDQQLTVDCGQHVH